MEYSYHGFVIKYGIILILDVTDAFTEGLRGGKKIEPLNIEQNVKMFPGWHDNKDKQRKICIILLLEAEQQAHYC